MWQGQKGYAKGYTNVFLSDWGSGCDTGAKKCHKIF